MLFPNIPLQGLDAAQRRPALEPPRLSNCTQLPPSPSPPSPLRNQIGPCPPRAQNASCLRSRLGSVSLEITSHTNTRAQLMPCPPHASRCLSVGSDASRSCLRDQRNDPGRNFLGLYLSRGGAGAVGQLLITQPVRISYAGRVSDVCTFIRCYHHVAVACSCPLCRAKV